MPRFDLNMLMYQISTYKPELVFRNVTLMGNYQILNNKFAEGIDILFSKTIHLALINLKLKALAFHRIPIKARIKSIELRNIIM